MARKHNYIQDILILGTKEKIVRITFCMNVNWITLLIFSQNNKSKTWINVIVYQVSGKHREELFKVNLKYIWPLCPV